MSFCPSKDIHSVYLDNELPEVYKKEYEAHIEKCPKCRKELEALRALHSALNADSASLNLDKTFMDESYQRLMVKMSYSKNVGKAAPKKAVRPAYFVPLAAAAAAAAFAFIVPVRAGGAGASGSSVAGNVAVASANPIVTIPTNANNVSFDSGKNVVVSGNIHETVNSSRGQKIDNQVLSDNLREIDVLRPDFKEDSISIRISVPGMGEFPVFAEINVPRAVISGKSE
ncbi:MAG: zf-HC2 domain-containing protein [Treponema sp.]|nr:zf-HC2 domain-containing protein [Treponema sp.]